jgi:hypothetical protein
VKLPDGRYRLMLPGEADWSAAVFSVRERDDYTTDVLHTADYTTAVLCAQCVRCLNVSVVSICPLSPATGRSWADVAIECRQPQLHPLPGRNGLDHLPKGGIMPSRHGVHHGVEGELVC